MNNETSKSSIVGPPQKQYFYVSLGNIFLLFFCGSPLVVEAPGQLPSLPSQIRPCGLYFVERATR